MKPAGANEFPVPGGVDVGPGPCQGSLPCGLAITVSVQCKAGSQGSLTRVHNLWERVLDTALLAYVAR
jgi:hypothetical protein